MDTNPHPLRAFRVRERLKATALAGRLGVNVSTLTRYETAKIKIPAERVLDIERATGVSRYELRPDIYGAPFSAKANATG